MSYNFLLFHQWPRNPENGSRPFTNTRKNPDGITIVDEHLRRLKGTYLDPEEIESIFVNYDRKGLSYPAPGKLGKFKDSDKYDDAIAIWTDYFNEKFRANPQSIRMS